jgi:hypothetical protein
VTTRAMNKPEIQSLARQINLVRETDPDAARRMLFAIAREHGKETALAVARELCKRTLAAFAEQLRLRLGQVVITLANQLVPSAFGARGHQPAEPPPPP